MREISGGFLQTLEKEIIDSFATQIRQDATVVLMRDINQKSSDTDKRTMSALGRSILLSYLLSFGAVSAGWLSIFSVGAILSTKPVQANVNEQAASPLAQTVGEEQAFPDNSRSSEYTHPVSSHQDLVKGQSSQTAEEDEKTPTDSKTSEYTIAQQKLKVLEPKEALDSKAGTFYTTTASPSEPQELCKKDDAQPEGTEEIHRICTSQSRQADSSPIERSTVQLPAFTPKIPLPVETFSRNLSTELKIEPPILAQVQPTTAATEKAEISDKASSSVPTQTTPDTGNLLAQAPAGEQPTATPPANTSSPTNPAPALNSVERNQPAQLTVGNEPTTVRSAKTPTSTEEGSAVHKGSGGASLLGGTIQAQSSFENRQDSSPSENARQQINPLAPTLRLQGAYVYQDESSARARLTGIYPFSTNALVGGTLDLTTGDIFANAPGGGLQLQLNELYFTGSLPSMPNLRMTVGLIDLTSYFDRNSFAKDVETHFFNSVFQTNPALAAAGIASRPGILFNWDITDNLQARAAAFSSHRNLGDFALDGYAGELAFRAGNAIVRGTFASNRDAGRNNGFREIYGLPRDRGDFGIRSSDRENAYGINAEYFIPEIKMGLFGRYGRYENTSLDKGGDTYSLGLNFLDLFMKDDRLGFGYGRDLSNDDLRSTTKAKVPDVWELFYDFLISPNLRAGVTLQAREQFSDFVAGFRVKTELDLLGRLFR
ncbi:MAG TPA: hypothetical protein V6C90_04485 [Coleofasciculaceae cyanobacterium]